MIYICEVHSLQSSLPLPRVFPDAATLEKSWDYVSLTDEDIEAASQVALPKSWDLGGESQAGNLADSHPGPTSPYPKCQCPAGLPCALSYLFLTGPHMVSGRGPFALEIDNSVTQAQ